MIVKVKVKVKMRHVENRPSHHKWEKLLKDQETGSFQHSKGVSPSSDLRRKNSNFELSGNLNEKLKENLIFDLTRIKSGRYSIQFALELKVRKRFMKKFISLCVDR